jgi:hypothetical protein
VLSLFVKKTTAIHWAAWPIILAPIVLFVLVLILPRLPHAFDLMPERYTPPRYQPYTTCLFLICAMYVYPVSLIFLALGLERYVLHPPHLVAIGAYSFLVSYAIYRFFARRREPNEET